MTLRFSWKVSVPLVLGTVVVIALIQIAFTAIMDKPLHLAIHGLAAAVMFVAGIAALVVTHFARSHKQYYPLSGLLGVTIIMVVPVAVVVVAHVIAEKAVAHFVFSHIIVYYLMFLPVGTWLIIPARMPKTMQNAENDKSNNHINTEENGS